MYDEEKNLITSAPHPQQDFLPFKGSLKPWSLLDEGETHNINICLSRLE